MAYETGRFVPQSCSKAAQWVADAAASGNTAAQYNLASRYFYGDGVQADAQQAMKWLQKATRQGSPSASPIESR
jgi:uncharacterized protein